LLNLKRFYDPLIAMLDRAMQEGFLQPKYRGLVLVANDPRSLLEVVSDWRAPVFEAWQMPGASLGT
jgi:predicted Rossmann-fold nucleotide-binding protein